MVAEEQTKQASSMKGKYTYVGLDLDTTGRRLIDEIIHIAAYTPTTEFSQYIMPLMNLNPGARMRHQIRVITVGFFRMLKSMETYKVLKTKTEIATLNEFLDWLEKVNTNDGIIFVYHDQLKITPYMLIEAMKKYNLMERFQKTVKAFVNGYELAGEAQGGNGIKYLTLTQNHKVQAEKLEMEWKDANEFEGNASVRAKLSYVICKLMSYGGEKKEASDDEITEMMNKFIRQKAHPIATELDEICEQEQSIERQSTLRDIFRNYFQASRFHRRRAVTFRRLLAESHHTMDSLQQIWTDGKREAIDEELKKIDELKDEDREELTEILDSHYDPEKKPIKPVVNQRRRDAGNGNPAGNNRRRRGPRGRSLNKENQGPRQMRSGSNRKRSTDKRYNNNNDNNNNNNNNTMDPKSGAIRKEHAQQQVDANQNTIMAAAH